MSDRKVLRLGLCYAVYGYAIMEEAHHSYIPPSNQALNFHDIYVIFSYEEHVAN